MSSRASTWLVDGLLVGDYVDVGILVGSIGRNRFTRGSKLDIFMSSTVLGLVIVLVEMSGPCLTLSISNLAFSLTSFSFKLEYSF